MTVATAEASGAGYRKVQSDVSCMLTRFRLRSSLFLPVFYVHFLRVKREARQIDGLLTAVFLVENLRTCYTLSLWQNERSLLEFGTYVHAHVRAARAAFGPAWNTRRNRPEIWSAQFQLWAVGTNINWDGINLRCVMTEAMS